MGKTALITGASGGIGLELALILAKDGYDLITVARSGDILNEQKSQIEKTYSVNVTAIPADLSLPDSAEYVYKTVSESGSSVDILINNAGFGDFGEFASCDIEKQTSMISVNITSLTLLTRLFLPGMISRKNGKILNVSSIAAFSPGPYMSVYYASKAYVLSFTEAISCELRGTGVTVTALCPGPTKTGFTGAANLHGSRLERAFEATTAKSVAKCGYRAMMRGRTVIVHGAPYKAAAVFERLMPKWAVRRIIASIQKARKNG